MLVLHWVLCDETNVVQTIRLKYLSKKLAEKQYVQCFQDPNPYTVKLYTKTGSLTKGGVHLKHNGAVAEQCQWSHSIVI